MKISKYLHSCLLVQQDTTVIVMDPGIFTYQAKVFPIDSLQKLDFITITHEHPDHMHVPFIKELTGRFPNVEIITNPSAAEELEKEHIKAKTTGNTIISIQTAPHEKLWDREVPQNVIITVFNKLTHPGDSLQFAATSDIVALPVTAPWGSTTQAVEKAVAIKPKMIIPVHDWMWKDDVRKTMYVRLTDYFKTIGVSFKGLETGEIIEV